MGESMIDYTSMLSEMIFDLIPDHIPDVTPVSFRDIDMNPPMSLELPCSDPCPECGAFNMTVGYYVCVGACHVCATWPEY